MIFYKSDDEIQMMRKSGRIVADVLSHIKKHIKAGMSTLEVENIALDRLKTIAPDAIPSFKGYMGYPASICISINSEVVHGIPSKNKIILDGDIVSIDFGVISNGYHGDSAFSILVGKGSEDTKRLLRVAEESLYEGIKYAKVGGRLHDISYAIQDHAESHGYSVVRDFVGHGIGKNMHESPQVPNFGDKGTGPKILSGMTIAIEPMVNVGGPDVFVLNDGWTAVTSDGSLSAHFEHTIAITDKGTYILTEL